MGSQSRENARLSCNATSHGPLNQEIPKASLPLVRFVICPNYCPISWCFVVKQAEDNGNYLMSMLPLQEVEQIM